MPHLRAKPSVTPMSCGRLPHRPHRHDPLWTTSKDRAAAIQPEGASRPIDIMSTEPPPGGSSTETRLGARAQDGTPSLEVTP
jgi:hypothetical protein